jgi:hypothetical protein
MAEHGIHLTPGEDRAAEVDAVADALGGRVGVEGVVAGLSRQARPSRSGRMLGRAVAEAYAWDDRDARDRRWWPQGVTSSADASATELVANRRLLVTTSYAKDLGDSGHGCRLSVVDLATLRYEHVLLVEPGTAADGSPTIGPAAAHAGGAVWHGPYLHVTATGRGWVSCRVGDLLRVPAGGDPDRCGIHDGRVSAYGHRFVLPVSGGFRSGADPGAERLRFSFLSLDRTGDIPALVAGEYARGDRSRRLARFEVDPATSLPRPDDDGRARPVAVAAGVAQMQGAAVVDGEHLVTVSRGRFVPGSVYAGRPGRLRRHRLAVPIGPEDLCFWPSTDRLWSVTEHPRRRWFFSMRRCWFD